MFGLNPLLNSASEDDERQLASKYNEAVNDSRFVKAFGITALIYALASLTGIALLGGGIGIGVGIFIMRYDTARYYRMVGIAVIVFAILNYVVPFVGAGVLSGAVLFKGIRVLGVLSKEGRNDEDWAPSQRRALIGTVASGIGTGVSAIAMMLLTGGWIVQLLTAHE